MLHGKLEMQFLSMMWLSTTRGQQKVNKYKKIKVQVLGMLDLDFFLELQYHVYNSRYLSKHYF